MLFRSDLKLGIGDEISVYKANMIIPQIAEDLTASGYIPLSEACPACGGSVEVRKDAGTEELYCLNEHCPAKEIKSFALFVSRVGLNIEGLSEATLEKFVGQGFIGEFADIFQLERYKDQIIAMEGMGEKSFANLQASINKARTTTCQRLLCAIGITGIGPANARNISRFYGNSWEKIQALTKDELLSIEGLGDVLAAAFEGWFQDENHKKKMADLLEQLSFEEVSATQEDAALSGMTFVITGSLQYFENRNRLKERLQTLGAAVAGSVSKKTSYLINNDIESTSSKNKKVRQEGVVIISEKELLEKFPQIKEEA